MFMYAVPLWLDLPSKAHQFVIYQEEIWIELTIVNIVMVDVVVIITLVLLLAFLVS